MGKESSLQHNAIWKGMKRGQKLVRWPPHPHPLFLRGFPPTSSTRRSNGRTSRRRKYAASPCIHLGASASKRILSHSISSHMHGFPYASPIHPQNRRRNVVQAGPTSPPPPRQPPQQPDAASTSSQQGFHTLPPRLP